jgi:hypothetical protein
VLELGLVELVLELPGVVELCDWSVDELTLVFVLLEEYGALVVAVVVV